MKHVIGGLAAVLLVLVPLQPAAAQQDPKPEKSTRSVEAVIDSSGIVPAVEAIANATTPELERALGELAQSLGVIAARIAGDQELRTSAARAGRGMAELAEAAVIEHSSTLQDALRALADRLDELAKEKKAGGTPGADPPVRERPES